MGIPDAVMEFYQMVKEVLISHGIKSSQRRWISLTNEDVLLGYRVEQSELQLAVLLKERNDRFVLLVELAHMEAPEDRLFVDAELSGAGSFYAVRAGEDELGGLDYEFEPFKTFADREAWIGDTALRDEALQWVRCLVTEFLRHSSSAGP